MAELDWETRVTRARAEAAAFLPFVGDWVGAGTAHGESATGTLRGASILDGSFVEVRERSTGHEDRCFYRYEAEDGSLRVMHFLGGGLVREYPVERTDVGLVWVSPPGEPLVEWFFSADELRCEVTWPGAPAPDVCMTWRRA